MLEILQRAYGEGGAGEREIEGSGGQGDGNRERNGERRFRRERKGRHTNDKAARGG